MGARGPAPTPTNVLAARGNPHARARLKREPAPIAASPDVPTWLKGEALAEWKRLIPRLLHRATLTEEDRGMLAGLCFWWGRFVECRAKLSRLGAKKFKGQVSEHPHTLVLVAWKEYSRAAQQFGLSPSSKSRVQESSPIEYAKAAEAFAPETRAAASPRVEATHTLKIAQ